MRNPKPIVSNDKCGAKLHALMATVAEILYKLKGDLGSFLVQAKTLPPAEVPARYALHFGNNMPMALMKLKTESVDAKQFVIWSENPEEVKIKWLKCIALYEDAFRSFASHRVHSDKQDYINDAQSLLNVVNSLKTLTDRFSASVELFTVDQDMEKGLPHLNRLEKAFRESLRMTQKFGFIPKLTSKERKELRRQILEIPGRCSE